MLSQPRIYLDFNASAPLLPQARAAMIEAMEHVGNPSSIHAEGRRARTIIEAARHSIAGLVGARAKHVIFTSGGTEAANLALTPEIAAPGFERLDTLLMSAGEHSCVLGGHRFAAAAIVTVPIDHRGIIDLAALEQMLVARPGEKILLALQHANNETGVIQPVAQAAAMVHRHGGLVVCDAVQSAGKTSATFADLHADMLIISAHKIGGPKGAGALVYDRDRLHLRAPMVRGGGQEQGARAGTENVAAIAGFGAAAEWAFANLGPAVARVEQFRGALESKLCSLAADAVFFGQGAPRLPNTSAFAIPGVSAETLLIGLDLEGIAVSSGSACSSGKVKRSHVLDAMGVQHDLSSGAVRISLGWSSTAADIDALMQALTLVLGRARRMRAA